MNPEEASPSEEAILGSIEASVTRLFPGFESNRARIHDTSSGERGILEFYTPEGQGRTKNPVIYALLKNPSGLTAYAQHLPPPEGKVSLIGATSYDISSTGNEVPWSESDADMMLEKLRVLTEGIELNDAFLDQVSTYSPKLGRFITFRDRLSPNTSIFGAETQTDDHEPIDWDQVDPELRAVYEEEMENILASNPKNLAGLKIRRLAGQFPNLAQLVVEENIRRGMFQSTDHIQTPEEAIAEMRAKSVVGERILRGGLHRLDAYEAILDVRRPKLSVQQPS